MNRLWALVVLIWLAVTVGPDARAGAMEQSRELSVTGTGSEYQGRGAMAMVGRRAPAFTAEAVVEKEFRRVSLGDYAGKWVVLFFYPNDFSFVCPTEIKGFNSAIPTFRKLNTEVLGVSVDSKFSHLAWIQRGDLGDLSFPLLSDITKDMARRYGILDESEGTALRGLFIIDPQGTLQYMVVHNMDVGRSVEETLRVLEALQSGSLCPLGWKPGEKTLGK